MELNLVLLFKNWRYFILYFFNWKILVTFNLQNAIGATLAMSMTDADQGQAYVDQRYQNYKYGMSTPRNYAPRQYRQQQPQYPRMQKVRQKSTIESNSNEIASSTRSELDIFVKDIESRAIIIFHSPSLNPATIRNACHMFGLICYYRQEFHPKGVTLLGYFDIRSSINAQAGLVEEITGQLAPAPDSPASVSVHFSVMLHTANNCDESRLVVRRLPAGRLETDVHSAFAMYGQLRSVQRTSTSDGIERPLDPSDPGTDSDSEFTVEYHSIQDAHLAASELPLSASQLWDAETTISFRPLDNRTQQLCRQLLALLTRWRAELSIPMSTSFGDLIQQHNLALQQQYMSAYGAMEVPMGMGMVVPGYGQMQYSYMPPGSMVLGRGGVPVAVSQMAHGHGHGLGHTYGLANPGMMYNANMGTMQQQHPSAYLGHQSPTAMRGSLSHEVYLRTHLHIVSLAS